MVLDSLLSWTAHINAVQKNLNSIVFCLHRLRRLDFPRSNLITVLDLLFNRPLTFTVALWGSARVTLLRPLQTAQKNAMRAVLGLRPQSPVSQAFRKFDSPNLSRSREYRLANLAFPSFHDSLPSVITCPRRAVASARRHCPFDPLMAQVSTSSLSDRRRIDFPRFLARFPPAFAPVELLMASKEH